MDTSLKYIEMCKKATEIQSNRFALQLKLNNDNSIEYPGYFSLLEDGDFIFDTNSKNIGVYLKCAPNQVSVMKIYYFSKLIWLPRQDQLQEIMFEPNGTWQYHMRDMFTIVKAMFECVILNENFNSYEQCWLTFVMKEKYNKRWINNDWRKIDE